MKNSSSKWGLVLLAIALIWGTTFAVMKDFLNDHAAEVLLFWRFLMAGILLAILAGKSWRKMTRVHFRQGILLSIFMYTGYILQVWGLNYTTASQAAFITGLSVIFVPFFSVIGGLEKVNLVKLTGALLGAVGLFLLTYQGSWGLGIGELLILLCAVSFALYIVFLSKFAGQTEPVPFVAIQMFSVTILIFITALFTNMKLPWQDISFTFSQWQQLIYLGIVATALTFLGEHKAQQIVSPTFTALALSMEPAFAALFAFFYLGESMTKLGYFGGGAIFLGMIIVSFTEKGKPLESIS